MSESKAAEMEKLSEEYRRSCERSARKEIHDIVDAYFDAPHISAGEKDTMLNVVVNLLKV